jgi:hypothetical protein
MTFFIFTQDSSYSAKTTFKIVTSKLHKLQIALLDVCALHYGVLYPVFLVVKTLKVSTQNLILWHCEEKILLD